MSKQIRSNAHIIEEDFALPYLCIAVHKAGPSFSEGFYLRPLENHTSLKDFIYEIIMDCLLVLADDFLGHSGSSSKESVVP
jgi:hypothetical protein